MGPSVATFQALGAHIASVQAKAIERDGLGSAWLSATRARIVEQIEGPQRVRDVGALAAESNETTMAMRRNLASVRSRLLAPPPERSWSRGAMGFAAMTAALAAVLVFVAVRSAPVPLSAHVEGTRLVTGTWADSANKSNDIVFSDGSHVRAQPGARVRINAVRPGGADVELATGQLTVHVVPRDHNLWHIQAGPYTVEVLGTKFDVSWQRQTGTFHLALQRGKVRISGPVVGERVLHGGQQVSVVTDTKRIVQTPLSTVADEPVVAQNDAAEPVDESSPSGEPAPSQDASDDHEPVQQAQAEPTVAPSDDIASDEAVAAPTRRTRRLRTRTRRSRRRAPRTVAATIETEPVAVAEVEETVVEPPPPTPAVADAPMPWLLAARGQWRGAVDAANAMGWDRLAEVATAKQLMAVADAARLAGLQRDARRGYGLVRTRHAGTPQAASAVFALGRVALRAGRLGEAATWFERYAQQFPRGLLVEQALGRSLSCRARLSDDPAACAAAKHYLRHDASGPRATLAREMTTRCRPNER